MKKIAILVIFLIAALNIYSMDCTLKTKYFTGVGISRNQDFVKIGSEKIESNITNWVYPKGGTVNLEVADRFENYKNIQYGFGFNYTYLYEATIKYRGVEHKILSPFDQFTIYGMLNFRTAENLMPHGYIFYKLKFCIDTAVSKNYKMEYFNLNDEKFYDNQAEGITTSLSLDHDIGIEIPVTSENFILGITCNFKGFRIDYKDIEYQKDGETIKYKKTEFNDLMILGLTLGLKI